MPVRLAGVAPVGTGSGAGTQRPARWFTRSTGAVQEPNVTHAGFAVSHHFVMLHQFQDT